MDKEYLNRIKWEQQELDRLVEKYPVKGHMNNGIVFAELAVPSIRYVDPKLVGWYQGGLDSLRRLASHKLQDDQVEIAPASDPAKIVVYTNWTRTVERPFVQCLTPVCNPNILNVVCHGEWSIEESIAQILEAVIAIIIFRPGSYDLGSPMNASASVFFSEQSKFELPLIDLGENNEQEY